ncbi:hypothetical protein QE418_002025 [Microbacterium testaceum]|nr:hypothetical protein [Microbacterium testaceum]MDR6096885.1 hypothetical protein [Microbacterium sp. SORGH_AS_0454]
MRFAVPRELRSWGNEIGMLFRRLWWIAILVLILSWAAFGTCRAGGSIHYVKPGGGRIPRRLVCNRGGSDPSAVGWEWKRDVSRNVLASWTAVAVRVGLSVPGHSRCRRSTFSRMTRRG